MSDRFYYLNQYLAKILIALGIYGFIARFLVDLTTHYTALIPLFVGFVLLTFEKQLRNKEKSAVMLIIAMNLLLLSLCLYVIIMGILGEYSYARKFIILTLVILVTGYSSYKHYKVLKKME